ncbi:MAG: S1 RNA-binding domain-containing protein, partial [Pseudomonadota bacterium]
ALKFGPDGLPEKQVAQLDETAEHLVRTERRSMAAERDATDRYLASFLADRVGAEFEGRITGVTGSGLFVRLAETGADGFCPASQISEEYWRYQEAAQALVADTSGRRYELGQPVQVRLREVTPLDGGLLLELISDPRPRRPGEKSQKRTRGKRFDRAHRSGSMRSGRKTSGGKGKRKR